MSLRNYKTKSYVPPIGEDLQHDTTDQGVSVHSDITLLSRISDMRVSQTLADGILSRFAQVKDDMPQDLSDAFAKLDDWHKMDFTDSRYLQSLSDKKANLKSFIDDYDQKLKDVKESVQKQRLAKARANADAFMAELFADD